MKYVARYVKTPQRGLLSGQRIPLEREFESKKDLDFWVQGAKANSEISEIRTARVPEPHEIGELVS